MTDPLTSVWMVQAENGTPIAVRARIEGAKRAAEDAVPGRFESAPYDFTVDRFEWRPAGGAREVLWAHGEGDELATGYTVSRWELDL